MVAINQFRGPAPVNPAVQQQMMTQVKPSPQMALHGVAQPALQQPVASQQMVPQTGLIGSEQALQGGMRSALDLLQGGNRSAQQQLGAAAGSLRGAGNLDMNIGQEMFERAAGGVGQFAPAGVTAQQNQLALSGALGQEAFDKALIDSPAQAFLREQGGQAVINQATALGGLGGGNVQKELARFGQGLASTDLQNQINNLNQLSSQGLQAAGQQGQFLSQAGQQQGNLAAANAANQLSAAQSAAGLLGQGAGITSGLAQQGANILSGTGNLVSQGRLQTGQNLAGQIGNTTSSLANLINQRGAGLSDIVGGGAGNIADLLKGAGQTDAEQQQNLATLLANLSVGAGTNLSGISQGAADIAQRGAVQQGNQQAQTGGAIIGALASLFSDERLKTNIVKMGEYKGYNAYKWQWSDEMPVESMRGTEGYGVLAQEVMDKQPEMVHQDASGYLKVNYGGLNG